MKISVAIVVHQPDLAQLLRTLHALDHALADSSLQASLAIVDNTPESERMAPRQHQALLDRLTHIPDRAWHYLAENRGFGVAHNTALAAVDSDWHLILNPDLELAPDALSQALAYGQAHPEAVLLMPRVTGRDGQQEFLGKRYPSVLGLLLRAFAPAWLQRRFEPLLAEYEARDLQQQSTPQDQVPIASGACMLCRTPVLKAAGGFDERYFLYFEDFDLSLRLAGLGKLVFLPAMQAVHHGGYTARKGLRHIAWFAVSGIRFFNRFGWRWY